MSHGSKTFTQAHALVQKLQAHPDWGGYYRGTRKSGDLWARVFERHSTHSDWYLYRLGGTSDWSLDGFVQRLCGMDPIPSPVFDAMVKHMCSAAKLSPLLPFDKEAN